MSKIRKMPTIRADIQYLKSTKTGSECLLFFAWAIYYMTKEKWSRYFTFITLALMCEEHAALTTFFIGLYITWRFRSTIVSVIKQQRPVDEKILIPLATMVMSVIWYWFTVW